jgi:hypothetical protein
VNAGRSFKHDVTIIQVDMNVKLGKDKLFSRVDGSRILKNTTNGNGENVANSAIGDDKISDKY